jgi:uncharacterized phiE125 gp8 family phage protein
MQPILIEGPAVEPVSLAEMRAHLRLDDAAEDTLVAGLIKAARLVVEAACGRVLIAQRWRIVLDRWPRERVVDLPLSPLIAVERISITDAAGEAVDCPPAAYAAEPGCDPPRLAVFAAVPEPAPERAGIAIDLIVGFGASADDVPAPLKLALKMLVTRWFENRGDVTGAQSLPTEALALVAPFRRARL